MAFVSQKSNSIPRSAIREMFALQTGMDDVISFALGEPDFTAPRHIIDATIRSFDRGETHYVPNNEMCIRDRLQPGIFRQYDVGYDRSAGRRGNVGGRVLRPI